MHLPRAFQRTLLAAVLLATQACSADDADGPPFVPVADVQQLMAEVIEPNAGVYWDAVGWILDEDGEHEIFPRNPEEWEAVHQAAFVVTEAGNLLMMDGRALDDGPWMAYAQAMIEVGRKAIQAAEDEDRQAVFDVGAELYFSCTACHTAYALDIIPPSEVADSLLDRIGS